MKNFTKFEEKIGIKFNNIDFLRLAFTHRSYLNEDRKWNLGHNERLEFLGDAVLEISVSDYLFVNFPNDTEGYLTSLRAALVNTTTLSEIAIDLDFEKFLLLSRGESKDLGRGRKYILANTFEAFIGAMYIDQGYTKTNEFVIKNLIDKKLKEIIEQKKFKDPKSVFQEKSQSEVSITPEYRVLDEWGPDHDKKFKIGVFLEKELIAEGEGLSKQEAEVEAAKKALEVKNW
jgi:ribonuclease-3